MNLHIHKYKVIIDTGKTQYLECRCGDRTIRQKHGGYQPIDRGWLKKVGITETHRTQLSERS